ncbi:MAG: sigma-S stabilization anti-adapter protein IraP [Enterobacter ludwigii]|nr:sigma-S stabilization anti-adapter protein IraP [Enterobacter ludwigii]
MKNLIAELLVKLAQKEEESKELVAQVEALESVRPDSQVPVEDAEMLRQYVKKLLRHPRN